MLTLHSLTVYMHSIGIGNVHYFGSNLQTCHPILLLKDPYLPSNFVDCSLCCFAVAGLKHDLQALRDQLAEAKGWGPNLGATTCCMSATIYMLTHCTPGNSHEP